LTPQYHVIGLLIKFQFFRGNCYAHEFKIELILQMYFYVVKCYKHTQSLCIHGKQILCKALFLFPLTSRGGK